MKTKIIVIVSVIFLLPFGEILGVASFAQNVGINTTGNAPNSSALLDINASPGNDKGILIPRLPLTATNVGTPISPAPGAGETGLMVFNTATAGVPPNDVVPGFYFWNGTAWAPLGGGATAGGWTDDGTVVRLTTSTDFVGIGTASPASTSALDITSTTKGILIPRMTTTQRDAITTPATGLQIYNIDCQAVNYWTGTCWIAMSKALPDPGIITSTPATTVFCAGQVRTYSIPVVPGALSYIWSVPAGTSITSGNGTTSISATFGNISGDVCIKASNTCETSGKTCLAVSVDPIPNTPGNITGITSINPGQTSVTYFVASVNGASTYTWVVPAGATIASGTGTTTIVVNFACNASSGNISVTANSTCGSSPASALALTITPLLAVSAGSAVFGGAAIGGNATGGTTAYTYSWSPSTDLSSSTVAIPTALCTGSTTTYTVTVTDSRSCTATSSVVVTRNFTVSAGAAKFGGVAIGGSPTATGGNPTYTYAWSPTADLSSSTVANPTALCTGSTTTYTVTTTDANSCTATSTVVVTRNFAASAGAAKFGGAAIGGSPTATGGNPTYTYAWLPATNLSSSIVANPTALCTGANTTYTITATDANSCTATSTVVVTRQGTGGTITNVGGYYIHTFTGSGTFTAGSGCNVEVLVVAGGGGGGETIGGGGGAGGLISNTSYAVTGGQVITVTVGGGGAGAPGVCSYPTGGGVGGSNSVFGSLTAIGGGGGGNYNNTSNGASSGGSGGGIGAGSGASSMAGTPSQGSAGGTTAGNSNNGAGGGGAGAIGANAISGTGATGGAGLSNSISGAAVFYAGGGGGGARNAAGIVGGTGGNGGGGAGGFGSGAGTVGTANRGGGGGGGGYQDTGGICGGGGAGGSGIVIVRYLQ